MVTMVYDDPAGLGFIIPVHMLAGLNQIESTSGTEIIFSSSFDPATTLRAVGTGITVDGAGTITGGTITGIELRSGGLVEVSLTGFAAFAATAAATAFTGGSQPGYELWVDLLAGRTEVTGSAASDWIDVGGGNDLVTGGFGNDRVAKFMAGNLRFAGGDGSDTLNLGAENGLIYPTPFIQQFVVDLAAGTAVSPYGGTFRLISVENVIGTSQADQITGSAADNVTGDGYFDRGADVIATLGGNDTVKLNGQESGITADGGDGVDTVHISTFGAPGGRHVWDLVNATANRGFFAASSLTGFENLTLSADQTAMAVRFLGDDASNRVEAGTGNDSLFGRGGTDVLFGGDGNDVLNGGAGGDFQIGGLGDDTYVLDDTGDTMQEEDGQGHDLVRASVDAALWLFVEDLTLTGGADLTGRGNSAANALTGNRGDNVLIGGGGADSLTGGLGADRFVWEAQADSGIGVGQRDVITDFAPGDLIDLGALDANTLRAGVQHFQLDSGGAFRAGEVRVALQGGHVVLRLNFDGSVGAEIEVLGVSSLGASDFLL